jgi:hypothetical protein
VIRTSVLTLDMVPRPLDGTPMRGGNADSIGDHCTIGILTVSDRASAGKYEDKGGPEILKVAAVSLC